MGYYGDIIGKQQPSVNFAEIFLETGHYFDGLLIILMGIFHSYISQNWLVVSTPLKNISQLGLLFPIYGKNVPNHQPAKGRQQYQYPNSLV